MSSIPIAMIKKLKKIYNKENFDYETGQVDPYKFHPTFYFFVKAFQVLDDETIPRWTYFVLPTMAIVGSLSAIIEAVAAVHGATTLDIPVITEGLVYSIVLVYKILILSCTQLNKPHYHCFLRMLREDFRYVCSEGIKYRQRFFKNQLKTWKTSLFVMVFTAVVTGGMIVFSIISLLLYLVTRTPGDGSERPLLFPFWCGDVDFGKTPVYEIIFTFTNFALASYAYNYIFMIQTQVVWVNQIATKADLVIWAIEDLLHDVHPAGNESEKVHNAELFKHRMRAIVSQHLSMYTLIILAIAEKRVLTDSRIDGQESPSYLMGSVFSILLLEAYAGVYKKLLMYEQKLCGPVVCLTAYCTAVKLDEGEFNAIPVLLGVAAATLVFIPSYLCTFLAIKVKSICDACWDTAFWNAGPEIRPYFVLIMQRSLRPLPLQAPGFEEISIQTFSSKMTSAYSLFNMLRQTNI